MEKNEPLAAAGSGRAEALSSEGETYSYHHAYSGLIWWTAAAFAVILGFSRLSYGLLLPSIRADLSGSYGSYGLVGTANFAGYLIGTLLVPPLLTRYGNRLRLNLFGLFAMNAAMIASAISLDLWQLGFWRLLIGIFSALATVLTMALMLERVYPAERGRASGLAWMGGSIGIVISGLIAPPIISTGSNLAWRLVWIIMGLVGIVAAFGLHRLLVANTPPPLSTERSTGPVQVHKPATLASIMAELFLPRGLLFITLTYFTFGFGYIIYSVFFISLLKEQGLPEILVGLVWAVSGGTGVFASFMWGRAVDRWPNGFILAASCGLGTLGAVLIMSGVFPVEFLGAGVMGLSLIGVPLIVTVLLKIAIPAEHYTSSFSFITAIFAIGQMIGPLVGGLMVDNFGLQAGIATCATLLTLAMLCSAAYGFVHKKA